MLAPHCHYELTELQLRTLGRLAHVQIAGPGVAGSQATAASQPGTPAFGRPFWLELPIAFTGVDGGPPSVGLPWHAPFLCFAFWRGALSGVTFFAARRQPCFIEDSNEPL